MVGGDPEEVIADNGVCQSCHSTLDPLSSHFFGRAFVSRVDASQIFLRAESVSPSGRNLYLSSNALQSSVAIVPLT